MTDKKMFAGNKSRCCPSDEWGDNEGRAGCGVAVCRHTGTVMQVLQGASAWLVDLVVIGHSENQWIVTL